MELENVLGAELYRQVQARLNGLKLLIDDGKLIPKHRFDCVNLSLKDHKEQVAALRRQLAAEQSYEQALQAARMRIVALEREVTILTEVSKHKPRNMQAVLAVLRLDKLPETGLQKALEKQLRALKKTDSYLFLDGDELYRLVPYRQEAKTGV